MILVEYPPGASDPIHRHNAHAFVYVLEGSIVMQLRDATEVRLSPGQTYYEGPADVHIVGRNASNTRPAKFVVFFIKSQGAPILEPVIELAWVILKHAEPTADAVSAWESADLSPAPKPAQ